jgi:hypothetical protein
MQQEIQLNIIPFTAPFEEAEFAFTRQSKMAIAPYTKTI